MLATMLFPDEIREYRGFQDYFSQRRGWFYALLLVLFVVDVIDTLVKGEKYYHHYGIAYPIRQTLLIAGAAGGMAFHSPRYDAAYAFCSLVAQAVWITVLFNVLD
ncbi:hypothetical protein [Aquamicrobium defluvii]|uniref:Uncharacterized protein n=1 Tax=Aquamicrobium defluvii TaxID=69279 RepID=A0A4R6Y9F6_9HYPH|nr:hypothetical protein [Aquamicrobium defluvii]TDR32082.1 hypothetical protein DES43_12923 [Aquamicrobium defluvii]